MINTVSLVVSYLRAHLGREEGQDLIEYAMLGGLIAAAMVAVLGLGIISGAIEDMGNGIAACVDFDAGTACTGGL